MFGSAKRSVFSRSMARVIGPTPPIGVIALTIFSTVSKSTSPTRFCPTRLIPTSMITASGLTICDVIILGRPTAEIKISVCRVSVAKLVLSGTVTVALRPSTVAQQVYQLEYYGRYIQLFYRQYPNRSHQVDE